MNDPVHLGSSDTVFRRKVYLALTMLVASANVQNIFCRQLRAPLGFTARKQLWMFVAAVSVTARAPAFGVAIRSIFLRRSFPQMAVAWSHDAADFIKSVAVRADTSFHVACVKRVHSRRERAPKPELKGKPMGADHVKGALCSASYANLAVARTGDAPEPQATTNRRRFFRDLFVKSLGVGREFVGWHRCSLSFPTGYYYG